jgi:hypothetical protein
LAGCGSPRAGSRPLHLVHQPRRRVEVLDRAARRSLADQLDRSVVAEDADVERHVHEWLLREVREFLGAQLLPSLT